MLNPRVGPLRPRALIVDDALARTDTAVGRAAESLALALESRNVEVIRALSFEDGRAIVGSDSSLGAVLLDWNLGSNDQDSHIRQRRFCRSCASGLRRCRCSSSPIAS
jgi:arginine decarboxylase